MRVHISLDDDLLGRLDARVGRRQRSRYIAEVLRQALDDEQRWEEINAAVGVRAGGGDDWDRDPAAWVREQRRGDLRRAG